MKTQFLRLTVPCISVLVMTSPGYLNAQQLEVVGELKVTQMIPDETGENLVTRKPDGTLETRSVASLPPPPPPIDTTRNLASDIELAKHICECGSNLPPFLIESLLASGYTQGDLLKAGVPYSSLVFTCGDSIIDNRDGKSYKTLIIGTQCWMAENLNVGTRIYSTTGMTDNTILEKYCYNNSEFHCTLYGGLYQWDEMMQYSTIESTQGICPTGWHLPSDTEFKDLEMAVGMTQSEADMTGYRGTNQGSHLAGSAHLWIDGALNQDPEFGLTGYGVLPGGYIDAFGNSFNQPLNAYLWSSTESGASAWDRIWDYNSTKINRDTNVKAYSFAVRCVKD